MAHSIVGRGLTFPLGINSQGGFALTSFRSELEQAIAIILATTPGERVMRPRFGSRLNELLYEPNNSRTASLVEQYVEDALAMWEPRIRVIGVTATPDPRDESILRLAIEYETKGTLDRRSLVYPFYTIPENE